MMGIRKAAWRPGGLAVGPAAALALWLWAGLAAPVRAQNFVNMELLSQTNDFGGGRAGGYASCWGYTAPDGTELAIIGTITGTDIYDATNPRNPVMVGSFEGPHSTWREMQTWSHYLYVVTEGGQPRTGMQIIDLAVPRQPRYVGNYDSTFATCHTVQIRDGFAYMNGTNNGLRILDLADPEHPRDVGSWHARYVHDSFARGDRLYVATLASGFGILDISDKTNPREIGSMNYGGAFTHNCGTSQDGKYLYTTDETPGGHLHVWNVQEPLNIVEVAEWTANQNGIIHNVIVRGDSAYIAYYTEGVQVLNITSPSNPQLVGYYDTYPGASGGFQGNWGVYPLARSGNIYASDIEGGLFIVKLGGGSNPIVDFNVDAPEAQRLQPGQSQALLFFDVFNGSSGLRIFDLVATSTNGWPLTAPASVNVPRSGVEPVLVTVQVPSGFTGPARTDVELCVTQRTTGFRICKRTKVAVPVTLQGFTANATAGGVELQWQLAREVTDTGSLLLQRAPVDESAPALDAAFETRATLGLTPGAGRWLDTGVDLGAAYEYRLVLVGTDGGNHVLGSTRVDLAAPAHSRLLGTAPNPFNPSTRIRFELARAGDVECDVHDARGRLVQRFTARDLGAGEHALVWDGRDARGVRQPSGVYLFELRSGAWTARGRMTLAK